MAVLSVQDIAALRAHLAGWRAAGETVALVPTMGNLHAGHLRLIERARQAAARTVVTVFVNPLQFDRPADLAAYPRTFDEDRRRLAEHEVDLLFAPSAETLYPRGVAHCTRVEVPGLSEILEGAFRPGHFTGVATVVTKLLNIVQPDTAVFGDKDYQQLAVIRRLVGDLDMPVAIVGVATEREADGLAMSSRNAYLMARERRRAPALYAVLRELARAVQAGAAEYAELERRAHASLSAQGLVPEYVSIRRAHDLGPPAHQDTELVALAAAWLGQARLIDNVALGLPQPKS